MFGRSGALHQGRINWSQIEKPDFERVVETLLHRKHQGSGFEVRVLDGRGGDGGIDVGVWDESRKRYNHIYQLKYFPEGFSSGFKPRRQQIKKSFDTAITKHKPPLWSLVFPGNPTAEELQYVKDLRGNRRVRINIWGRAQLDDNLLMYPDVEAAALRQPLVEVLKEIGQEKAGLVGPHDLPDRIANLHARADSRSAHWAVDFQAGDGVVTQVLRPKHPRAQELEPISMTVNLAFGEDDGEIQEQARKAFSYGPRQVLKLPGKVIESIKIDGPEWVPRMDSSENIDHLAIEPVHAETVQMQLSVLDDRGFTVRSAPGSGRITKGPLGQGMTASFFGGALKIDAEMPNDTDTGGVVNLSLELATASATDAYRAASLFNALNGGPAIEIHVGKQLFVRGRLDGESEHVDPHVMLLLEDLRVLEDHLQASFNLPQSTTDNERIRIRIARLLAEGRATWLPEGTSLPITLKSDLEPEVVKLLEDGGAVWAKLPAFAFQLQGRSYNLGPAFIYHPHVTPANGAGVLERLSARNTDIGEVSLIPQGPQRVMAHLLAWSEEGSEFPPAVQWGLPGIPEVG